MNLYTMMAARAAAGRPVRVGLIGAGKFGSMILSQAQHIAGHARRRRRRPRRRQGAGVAGACRLACRALRRSESLADAVKTGTTCVLDDAAALLTAFDDIDCIIEATGHPIAGVRHALAAIEGGKHVVMVNVEADAMCGPVLAAKAPGEGTSSTAWPTAISRPSSANWSTGRAPAASS